MAQCLKVMRPYTAYKRRLEFPDDAEETPAVRSKLEPDSLRFTGVHTPLL